MQLRACGARRLGKKKEKKMVAEHEVFFFCFCFFVYLRFLTFDLEKKRVLIFCTIYVSATFIFIFLIK